MGWATRLHLVDPNSPTRLGKVYLVGAGPGDPLLITVRGKELLSRADIVIYDYLADVSLLQFAPTTAQLVDVGKRPNRPMAQEEIDAILLSAASSYRTVIRLKGGDPMLFGRGGEEAEALGRAGIEFEIVPGVSSAIAVPAYAGIPVTHRGVSTALTVITGHRQTGCDDNTNYEALAKLGGTIVVLMGVAHRGEIAARLMAAGLSPTTPVAAIRWGTRADQESLRCDLASLAKAPVRSPATIVIGEVAKFNYNFFESRPLFGTRIIITRAANQQSELSRRLSELGAKVILAPAIKIAPPRDGGAALEAVAKRVDGFNFLVFSSVNAVEAFFSHVEDLRILAGVRIAAVGTGTARAIEAMKLRVDLIAQAFVAESLLDCFEPGSGKVLLPQARQARDVLAQGFRSLGYQVEVVEAYETLAHIPSSDELDSVGEADAICFTSSSTVSNFLTCYGKSKLAPLVFSIGPITTATAVKEGIEVSATATEHDIEGLVAAVLKVLGKGT